MITGFEDNKANVEEDADTEIEELKRKYQGKLAAEKMHFTLKRREWFDEKKIQCLTEETSKINAKS